MKKVASGFTAAIAEEEESASRAVDSYQIEKNNIDLDIIQDDDLDSVSSDSDNMIFPKNVKNS